MAQQQQAGQGLAVSIKIKKNFDAKGKYKMVLAEVVNLAQKAGKRSVKDREKTTATWSGPRPEFIYRVWERSDGMVKLKVLVADDASSMAARKWKWIVHGTKVGHAMIISFKAKTKYRTVKSFPGHYQVLFVSKKVKKPGVKARKLDQEINKRVIKYLDKHWKKTVIKGLKRQRVTGWVSGMISGVTGGKIGGTGRT